MDPGALVVGGSCCALGVGLLLGALHLRNLARECEQTRVAHLKDRPEGSTVRLKGTVRCDEPLSDSVLHEPCVYFSVALYQLELRVGLGDDRRHSHRRRRQFLHSTVERVPRWELEDETGGVRVECEDFEVVGGPSAPSERITRSYNVDDLEHTGTFCHIPVGHPVFVSARLVHHDGEPVLTGPMAVDGREGLTRRVAPVTLGVFSALVFAIGLLVAASAWFAPAEPAPPVEAPLTLDDLKPRAR